MLRLLLALVTSTAGDVGVAADAHTFEHLGLTVRADGSEIVVTKVDAGGPAHRAGLSPGHRIVRVRDVPVETLDQLVWLLRPRNGAQAIDILVEGDEPSKAAIELPTGFRASALAIGNQFTTTDDVRSAWLGGLLGFAPRPGVWVLVGMGYYAVGPEPGFGKHGLAPVAGAEYELALGVERLSAFGRGLLGITISFGPGSLFAPGEVAPIAALGQVGLRFYFLEVAATGSWGPAEGLNLGIAGGLSFTID